MTSYVALHNDPVAGDPTSCMHNPGFQARGLNRWHLDIPVAAHT